MASSTPSARPKVKCASLQAHQRRMAVGGEAGTPSQVPQAAAMTTADGLVMEGLVGTQLLCLQMEHHFGHAGLLVDLKRMTPALKMTLMSTDPMASSTPSVRVKANSRIP
mmetsp:Transcript_17303/g.20778  ORF Transcript_17303/g.20778 Transcript_17303/m.20778 type:complete len:110 (+) Transcript_17303:2-331(+)